MDILIEVITILLLEKFILLFFFSSFSLSPNPGEGWGEGARYNFIVVN